MSSVAVRGPSNPANPWSGRRTQQYFVLALALVVVTFAVYYRVHAYPFIDIDDHYYVTQNPRVLGSLNGYTVLWAFTHTIGLNYSPLTFLSHNLDVQMFQLEPGRHHLENVLLHALNAVLLFWVLIRATDVMGRSFLVTALFALHPVQVENVAWISERKTMLSTVFFLVALGAYRWYARDPKLRRMAAVAFLYGLGVLAKPQVITFPFVLLLWDYWPLRRISTVEGDCAEAAGSRAFPTRTFGELVKEKIPLFVIAAFDAVATVVAQHVSNAQVRPFTIPIRVGNAILSYARYLGIAFWPRNLALMYLHPGRSLRWGQVWAALLLLSVVSTLVVLHRQRRYLLVGWLWFLGTLVPMIGLLQVDVQALADRYAYISFIGLFIMVCWGAAELAERAHAPRVLLPAGSVLILLIISAMTYQQVGYWSDPTTLWTHTLNVTHRNWVADVHLGGACQLRGQTKEALVHFYRAAQDVPRDPGINMNIALIEHRRGNLTQAIHYYQKVLAVSKDNQINAQMLTNLGHAYANLGDYAQARQCYEAAQHPRPVPPPPAINWRGDWWRDIARMLRECFGEWRSKPAASQWRHQAYPRRPNNADPA